MSTYSSNGHLRSGEIVLRCGDIPGQQFLDAIDRVIGDLFEYAAEIDLRIKPVELGCSCRAPDYAESTIAVLLWCRFAARRRGIVLLFFLCTSVHRRRHDGKCLCDHTCAAATPA